MSRANAVILLRVFPVTTMQSIFLRTSIWLFFEVFLTLLGLDDLADYSEYVFKVKDLLPSQQATLTQYECFGGVCIPKGVLPTHLTAWGEQFSLSQQAGISNPEEFVLMPEFPLSQSFLAEAA